MLYDAIVLQIFCSWLTFVSWLQNHLLLCPFKYFTGIDCPGCGFQRSVIALIQGDLHRSLTLYPAAIPLLLFFVYGFADHYFKLDTPKNTLKKTLFVAIGALILISYSVKLWGFYQIYNASALAAI
jgi:hypothetical protein